MAKMTSAEKTAYDRIESALAAERERRSLRRVHVEGQVKKTYRGVYPVVVVRIDGTEVALSPEHAITLAAAIVGHAEWVMGHTP